MRVIDETFLTTHPATSAWAAQRPKCERCCHHVTRGAALRCVRLVATGAGADRHNGYGYCIDARLPGGVCGPDGVLFRTGGADVSGVLFARWPDDFMCPIGEVEEYMTPPCARSDDFERVNVTEFDETGSPSKWERV